MKDCIPFVKNENKPFARRCSNSFQILSYAACRTIINIGIRLMQILLQGISNIIYIALVIIAADSAEININNIILINMLHSLGITSYL